MNVQVFFRSCWPAGAPCAPSLAARLVFFIAAIRRLALGLRLAHGFELWRNLAGACSFTNSCRCPSLWCSCLATLRRLRLEFFAQLLFLSIVLRPFSSAGLFEKRSSSTLTKHAFPCVAPAISPSPPLPFWPFSPRPLFLLQPLLPLLWLLPRAFALQQPSSWPRRFWVLLLPGLRAGPGKTPGSANVCDSWDARLLEVKGHPGLAELSEKKASASRMSPMVTF